MKQNTVVVPGHPQALPGDICLWLGLLFAWSEPRVVPCGIWGQRGRRARHTKLKMSPCPVVALGTCSPRLSEN